MGTTTIRVDTDTHERLRSLSASSGASITETVRRATEALERQRFAERVALEFATLRTDESSWREYLADAESVGGVADGII